MVKIVIKNESFMKFIRRYPNLRKLFVFRINHIHNVKNDALRSELYDAIYTENKTAKSTRVKRFEDIDAFSLKYLAADRNTVHDIAVSNGVTSVELFNAINRCGKNTEFYISDKYNTYYMAGKIITRIYGSDKKLICGYFAFLLADCHVNSIFFLSHLLFHVLKIFPVPGQLYKISLLDRKTVAYIEQGIIREIDYDVFSTMIEDTFTFVRCMNLLQIPYFDEEHISIALKNIKFSLRDSGIFQIGRTLQNGTNNVSFYRKLDDKFILIEHVNRGYENNALVVSV